MIVKLKHVEALATYSARTTSLRIILLHNFGFCKTIKLTLEFIVTGKPFCTNPKKPGFSRSI